LTRKPHLCHSCECYDKALRHSTKEAVMSVSSGFKIILPALIWTLLIVLISPVAWSAETKGQGKGHKVVTGVVTGEKSGLLTVKTPDGTMHTINPKASGRHGHEVPKVGDEVTMVLDHNNTIIEVHPKGKEGTHHFITGKLAYVGKMKKEIKLATPEGEKTFPIERLEIKTGGIEEGALVTAEVNESGTIIDLHRAGHN
jgi:hypothetical protein